MAQVKEINLMPYLLLTINITKGDLTPLSKHYDTLENLHVKFIHPITRQRQG